jgi:ABC-2 type transport system permease protein
MKESFRGLKQGANSVILTGAVIAVIVMVYLLSARHPVQHDFTKEKSNMLQKETIETLKRLDETDKSVRAVAFFTNKTGRYKDQITDLLEDMRRRSTNFMYQSVDPDLYPEAAKKIGMKGEGIIFECGTPGKKDYKRKIVPIENLFTMDPMTGEMKSAGEEAIVNAIIEVALREEVQLCFVQGHGERATFDTSAEGISKMIKKLQDQSYGIIEVNILKEKTIPDKCSMLVIAGPAIPFQENETKEIIRFINNGKGMLLMMDPFKFVSFGQNSSALPIIPSLPTELNSVLERRGVSFVNDILIDQKKNFSYDGYNLLPSIMSHIITNSLIEKDFPVNLNITRSLKIDKNKEANGEVFPLLETSDSAMSESVEQMLTQGSGFDPSQGKKEGPQVVAAALESKNKKAEGRIVVVGNTEFITNNSLYDVTVEGEQQNNRGAAGNADLFLNSVNWLAGEEDIISLRPKSAPPRMLTINNINTRKFIYNLFTFIIPLSILILGGLIWNWRRRL